MEPTRSRIKTCNLGHTGKRKLAKSQFVLVWLRVSPHLRCCTCFSCVVIGSCVVPLCEEELRQRSLSSSYWIGLENRFQINQLQHRTVPCQLETIRVTDLFCRQKNKIAKPSLYFSDLLRSRIYHIALKSQIFSRQARPNSVNKNYLIEKIKNFFETSQKYSCFPAANLALNHNVFQCSIEYLYSTVGRQLPDVNETGFY